MKKYLWLLIVLGFFYLNKAADANLPQPYAWVNDYADLLDPDEERILNDSLQMLQKISSTQVFIAIIENIPEDSYLEKYSQELAANWKIGVKGSNNGVLMLISLSDRKMRIEVGYGLEGVLTDAISRRIIDNEIKPEFKTRNYYNGLLKGSNAIIKAVKGEYKGSDGNENDLGFGGFIFFIIFIILIIFSRLGRGNRHGGRGMWIGSSGSGWSSFSGGGSSSGFSGGGGGSFGGGGASGSW